MTRLTCEEAFARLDDFLDRELDAAEMRLVQEHLDACAACAGEFRFEATVLGDLRAKLTRIDVPRTLLAKISARIAAVERAERDGH